jgi:transcriptional regulator with XRE-family HTH domain
MHECEVTRKSLLLRIADSVECLYGEAMVATRTRSQVVPTKSETGGRRKFPRDLPPMAVDRVRNESPAVGRVLRHARQHRGLTLREVERITGRSNAYLSQVERGLIKKPDPLVLLELADLYRLDFDALAEWAGFGPSRGATGANGGEVAYTDQTFKRLLRLVKQLNSQQRSQVLAVVEDVLRSP